MSQRDHVLQLENITMQFGGVVAVNNLSLEVNEGEAPFHEEIAKVIEVLDTGLAELLD